VTSQKRILICQHLTCRKQGAAKILAAFQAAHIPNGISCEGCGCLGQCGNGPNVLILPAQIWYDRVSLKDISAIISKLENGE
jgi:(2Fe-2S) ferredoxin